MQVGDFILSGVRHQEVSKFSWIASVHEAHWARSSWWEEEENMESG
jgi:hypothetical protein